MSARGNALGTGVGNFLSAFTQSRQAKEDKKEREEELKVRTKIFEIELKKLQKQQDAEQKVTDFATGVTRNPETGRPTMGPIDFGSPDELTEIGMPGMNPREMLDSAPALIAMLQSGAVNMGDVLKEQGMDASRKQSAANLDRVMGGSQGKTDKAGNSQFIFLPSIDPDGGVGARAVLNPAYQERVSERKEVSAIQTTFNRIQNSILKNQQLSEGHPLQATGSPSRGATGFGARASGAISGFFGAENPFAEAETAAAVQQQLAKDYAVAMFTNEELKALKDAGRITDRQFTQLQSANPNLETHWAVNAKIQIDGLELKLNNADILGLNVTNEQEMRDYIDNMRNVIEGELDISDDGATSGAGDIADAVGGFAEQGATATQEFATATKEQLAALDLESMTKEQIAAIRSRYEQLKNGK